MLEAERSPLKATGAPIAVLEYGDMRLDPFLVHQPRKVFYQP